MNLVINVSLELLDCEDAPHKVVRALKRALPGELERAFEGIVGYQLQSGTVGAIEVQVELDGEEEDD